MKKILFIDRDGTIIKEPEDEQIDSFEKLQFLPGVITNLSEIAKKCDFTNVMISNQDGLGTDVFPENTFFPVQNFIVETLKDEGVVFEDIHIDRSFPKENSPTRKPETGLLTKYFSQEYDLENSFVIGDRWSDVELAKNLNCKAIFITGFSDETELDKRNLRKYCALITSNWNEIYKFLNTPTRNVEVYRKTNETEVYIEINPDGDGQADINTGLHFFDHMLEQIAKHGSIDLKIKAKGDLEVDEHHLIEDVGIVLGQAFKKSLSDKRGINRYGFFTLPMDESLAQTAIDFSGRAWLVWNAYFKREKVGDMPTEMFLHFFKSFSDNAECNLNITVSGENEHHKIEAVFKSFGKAIKQAVEISGNKILSTKGII